MSTDPVASPAAGPTTPPDPQWASYSRIAVVSAVAGIAIYLIAGFANAGTASGAEAEHAAKQRFALAYLSGYIFWFSLPLGGLALLMLGYLAKASWGLLLRRPMEAATRTLPLMFVLFLPMFLAANSEHYSPYYWTAPEKAEVPENSESPLHTSTDRREQTIRAGEYMIARAVRHEREMREKGNFGFLSMPSYIGVSVLLFAIWGVNIYYLNRLSRDASDETNTTKVDWALHRLEQLSGPGMIVYAITITAASSLWVMSLQPGWSSTMFPVIFAINQFLTCFAFCVAMFLFFVSRPPLRDVMRPKFQLDMGTLLLAFTMFWAYTSFSQYMLVWIGNLPEEIPFYLKRSAGGWYYVSAALIAFHFALPFLLLLFRDIKLHPVRLRVVSVYLLIICAVDVVWWTQPTIASHGSFPFWLMDFGAILGIGGVWGLAWIWQMKKLPLLPASQIFLLPEGHHHEHH